MGFHILFYIESEICSVFYTYNTSAFKLATDAQQQHVASGSYINVVLGQ